MDMVGIRGRAKDWMQDYLADRRFMVKIGEKYSEGRESTNGVAQGSILGPLIYVLYVNDIHTSFKKCTYFLYADDTVIVSVHKSYEMAIATLSD